MSKPKVTKRVEYIVERWHPQLSGRKWYAGKGHIWESAAKAEAMGWPAPFKTRIVRVTITERREVL